MGPSTAPLHEHKNNVVETFKSFAGLQRIELAQTWNRKRYSLPDVFLTFEESVTPSTRQINHVMDVYWSLGGPAQFRLAINQRDHNGVRRELVWEAESR